jgi:hypothetical protein
VEALGLDEKERDRLVGAVPGRTTAGRAATALPVPQGPVLGRDAEIEALAGLVTGGGARLVTLTGPGGVGKTTLAFMVAGRVTAGFPGGVTLVDLAATTDAGAVLPAVATALGVPEGDYGRTPAGLAPYLEQRRLLLVLDNLEQVLDCAAELAELVTRCPDIVVLATSRAPLRVRPEREHRVAPLGEQDAVRLFLERANSAGRTLAGPIRQRRSRRCAGRPRACRSPSSYQPAQPPRSDRPLCSSASGPWRRRGLATYRSGSGRSRRH